jgi:hypothetical protein
MTWSFREQVLLAGIRKAGHQPEDDRDEGWAVCARCGVAWFVKRRAHLADLSRENRVLIDGIHWDNPTDFGKCQP